MSAGEACAIPQIYSAISQRLIRHDSPRERWLAVGDAALSVDPISGSGVIRALRTAQAAADTVLAALHSDPEAIDNYEADRDRDCTSYLFERSAYYELETRWASEKFWDRRLSAAQNRAQAQ
jgi:flavin-dependent dehydrogenase